MEINRENLRVLTKNSLMLRVLRFERNNKDKGSFILTDIAGTIWDQDFIPFFEMYEKNGRVAGQEMGKLLAAVAKELGLKSQKENRFGKKNAITRYFFN
jgi:hypothetical protein